MNATLELDQESVQTIKNNFHELHHTQGRAKLIEAGVYEYRGRTIRKVLLPKELRTELADDQYITYGWEIDDLKGKVFRKKNVCLDFIDGFVR